MTSVISPVFERIFVASTLEEAVINSLHKWFPTYLHEVERQLGLNKDTIEPPVNYSNRNSFDAEAGERLPKCVVVSPGTTGEPKMTGSGAYRATWQLGVGVAMVARDEVEANMKAKIYGACARAIVLQNASLGDIGAVNVTWLGGELYDDLPIPDQIQLYKAAEVRFEVDVENVINKRKGPDFPDGEPYVYGEVQDVIINIVKEAIA